MSEHLTCTHCGLPVPAGLVDEASEKQFCCGGCKMVYEAIHSCGLDRYYDIKDTQDEAIPAKTTGKGYEHFDDPAFAEAYVRLPADDRAEVELRLESIHCAACIWLIERLPRVVPGVIEARVDFRRQLARIAWNPQLVKLPQIARTLDSLGYPPHPFRGSELQQLRRQENRKHLINIGIAGACAGNVMLLSFALWGGRDGSMDPAFEAFFQYTSLAITLIALAIPGRVFFIGALSSLRTRLMHMDLPVALALTAGTLWGAYKTIVGAGSGEIYFESLTAVILLLLVGRWLQHRHQLSAHDAVELLYSVTSNTARLLDESGAAREVPIEALTEGALVELRAGDSVPADGVVAQGDSEFDCSMLTGESRPITLREGERLFAGAVNLSRRIVLRAEATGSQTRVGRLMSLVEQFAESRPPIVRLADRVAHYFVITVLLLALLTVVGWIGFGVRAGLPLSEAVSNAVEHAVALLIVTCPCALGLATPLAVVAAVGRAAGRGIFIKGGEVIEQLASRGTICLDKTGTITQGQTKLLHWSGDDSLKPLIAAAEASIAHPIARALVSAFGSDGNANHTVRATQILGGGVEATIDGQTLLIGSRRFVGERVDEVAEWVEREVTSCATKALTPVLIALGGEIRGVAGLGDPLHDDAAASIARLRQLGWRVRVLSGDHEGVVQAVARALDLPEGDCEGGASPERKAEAIRDFQETNPIVIMVGDGVNDAAALAAASIGVAVSGGAEASLTAADVFLRSDGLQPIIDLIEGGRRAVGVVKRNLAVSLVYNILMAGLAIAGVINPIIAAVIMPISSLSVVTLSYRSRTF